MFFLIAAIGAGLLLPVQTAVNSRLGRFLGGPLRSALVSFVVGTLALGVLSLIAVGIAPTGQALAAAAQQPLYLWLGGLLGAIFLTSSTFAFPRIGSVETALWPLVGSVTGAIVIDATGWFNPEIRPITVLRVLGAVGVVVGVALASGALAPGRRDKDPGARRVTASTANPWFWRILMLVTGVGSGLQGAINGALGSAIGSPLIATLISFCIGTVTLMVALAINFGWQRRAIASGQASPVQRTTSGPWWMWLGGLLGAGFVGTITAAAPVIGAGPASVATYVGTSSASLLIDRFGLVGAQQKQIHPLQLVGVAIVLAGVMAVQFG